jgi:hypothetical protein
MGDKAENLVGIELYLLKSKEDIINCSSLGRRSGDAGGRGGCPGARDTITMRTLSQIITQIDRSIILFIC